MAPFLLLAQVIRKGECAISGIIRSEAGEVLPGITVVLEGTTIGNASNFEGNYQVTGIAPGSYKLLISGIGFTAQHHAISLQEGQQLKLDIQMKEDLQQLNEVVVEGKSIKAEIEETGFAVNVVETKKASLQSIQTNDLLNRAVGVRVRQNGGLGSSVNYNLNGMSGNSVRIFIDGIPISTYGPSFSLNSIPPSLIERIDIYKGVIPAHLADDALGGAINVILKKEMTNNLTASVSYGSFNTQQASVSGMYRDNHSGFTVRASGFHNYSDNNYEVWGKFVRNILANGRYDYVRAKRFNDAYRSSGGQVQLGFTNVKWADQFFIGYNGSDDYNEIQHGRYMSIPYKGRFSTSQAHVLNLSYQKDDFLTKGLNLSFNGMVSDRNEIINDTVKWNYNWFGEKSIGLNGDPILRPDGAQQGAPTLNHIDRNVNTFRSGLTYTFNTNHKIVFSHMFYSIDRNQQDMRKSAVEREFIGTRDLTKNISALAYEVEAFNSNLKANIFGKFYQQKIDRIDPILIKENGESRKTEDRVQSNRNTFGYGFASSYTIKPRLLLLFSAEKAVRMPSEGEIFGSPGDNIVENIGIRPEISNNLNIGFRAGPYGNGLHRFNIYASGFLRDTKDKIVQRINPRLNDAVQTDPFENLGKTKSIGFETELKYELDNNLNILLSVSRFNSVYNLRYDANGNEYNNYNQQLPNEPFFTVNSNAQYTLNDLIQKNSAINFNYSFGFVDRFYTTWLEIEDFRTPRQFIQDVGVSYVFPNKKFVVSADARNIFDKQAYDNFAVQKPGRAFYLKINYTINNF
ncbi:TonB-dependent receptor [Marivirga lumbricoides]|uniref:TonB-dependent receptor n=1 Tax=Marivirga lumbricoides TaxID=1046115 RepID=A0A2T4DTF8_9BACT|nr:TonB-dependent receptor [Marivirga lumbricoides]